MVSTKQLTTKDVLNGRVDETSIDNQTSNESHRNSNGSNSGLFWNDLSVQTTTTSATTAISKNKSTTAERKYLLRTCHGFVPNGHLCGLLGPSGAGKSTMLSALGGTLATSSSSTTTSSSSALSSLPNNIRNNIPTGNGLHLSGEIGYYHSDKQCVEHLDVPSGRVAWLSQKDNFFSMLTVEETLHLAAFLELSRRKTSTTNMTSKQRRRRVQHIMDSLGLTPLKHRRIGEQQSGLIHNGLSGGEKRRLSLALELISTPMIFLGDEPTTGLDSTLSEKVVRLIKKLVVEKENIPCVLSLHQPRSSIWRLLDSVVLLAPGGRVCYSGPTENAISYFSKLGYQCPPQTNPAEFLLDLVSIDTEDPEKAIVDESRIERLAVAYANDSRGDYVKSSNGSKTGTNGSTTSLFYHVVSSIKNVTMPSLSDTSQSDSTVHNHNDRIEHRVVTMRSTQIDENTTMEHSPSYNIVYTLQRFGYLLLRSWRQNVRNHHVNAVRLFVSAGNAYFFTLVYPSVVQKSKKDYIGINYDIDDSSDEYFYTVQSIPDRTALLSFGVINITMMTVMKTIDLFAKEIPVVLREQSRRQYTSLEYLLSKVLAEIPLDTLFSIIFTTILKTYSGLRISWSDLTIIFCWMTVCGASLGFAIGACTPSAEVAMSVGVPLLVLLLGVGVIAPSGVDPSDDSITSPSLFVVMLKQISPIAYAIRAACVAEYRGMEFMDPSDLIDLSGGGRRRNWFQRLYRKMQNLLRMGGLALVKSGDEILQELGLKDETYEGLLQHLIILSICFLFISWMGLLYNQQGSNRAK